MRNPPWWGTRAPQRDAPARAVAAPVTPSSPRLVTLLALDSPVVEDLSSYLADSDPVVRVAALSVLTENTPDGFADELVRALGDEAASVRRAATESLRELVEVLPGAGALAEHLGSPDPLVRATVVDLLRALRAGLASDYRAALGDTDHRVRIEAVRALVSLDDADAVASIAGDVNREVRIAVAHGLASIGSGGVEVIRVLAGDLDPLVRAAALTAYAALGTAAEDITELAAALRHSAWQVRVGAARGLAGAPPEAGVAPLTEALADRHLDVRKAAVLALSTWSNSTAALDALESAITDPDADVRAYARRAVTAAGRTPIDPARTEAALAEAGA